MNKLLSTVGHNKASMSRLLLCCNSRAFSVTSEYLVSSLLKLA